MTIDLTALCWCGHHAEEHDGPCTAIVTGYAGLPYYCPCDRYNPEED